MSAIDHKRIARNTLLLYARMGLIMIISLWTSRVVLSALGATDFGLYNVIGGIVVAFSFMSGAMSASCNRFYSVELGKGDFDRLHDVFKANLIIFSLFSLVILLICETAGLWLLKEKMVIPEDRMNAAVWVYQFSIVTFLSSLLAIPFKSAIIAREKMKVYAYSSVLEAAAKLTAAFLLSRADTDKLVFYGFLMMLISIVTNLFYILYCRLFYKECQLTKGYDKKLAREILSFNGWGMIGSLATVARSQGVNILLNLFYGPVVNAARGVANQVYVNVNQFVSNYALAFAPQIVKSYSSGEKKECLNLIFKTSRLSFLLLFVIALPLINEMDIVMNLWLTEVPQYSVTFARLMMISALVDSLYPSLFYGIQASGKVKWLNILVGGCQIAIVLVSYIVLKFTSVPAQSIFWFILAGSILSQILRIILSNRYISLPVARYLKSVILPVAATATVGSLAMVLLSNILEEGILRLFLSITLSIIICGAAFLIEKRKSYGNRS